jgi:hypothetical protein
LAHRWSSSILFVQQSIKSTQFNQNKKIKAAKLFGTFDAFTSLMIDYTLRHKIFRFLRERNLQIKQSNITCKLRP